MSDSAPVSDRLGTLEETAGGWRLRFVRHLDRSPATVWRAFADPDLVARWFPTTIEGNLVAGAPLRFELLGFKAEPFQGKVVEVDEPHLLVLLWGLDTLRFELAETPGGTDLTMTVEISELGRAARDGAGWHQCLDNLARMYAHDPDLCEVDTWAAAHPHYVRRFGPEAAASPPPQEFLDTLED